jgi:hypothetical protein
MRRWERLRSKGKTFFVVSFSLLFVLLNTAYQVFESGFSKNLIGFTLIVTPVVFVAGLFLGVVCWESSEQEYRKQVEGKRGVS